MNYLFAALITLLSVSLYAQQGIRGTVTWVSGNQMPGPDKPSTQPKKIAREIHIYKAISMNEVTSAEGVFFSDLKSPLLKKVKSKKNGSFCVKLPPGEYSVFVKEPKGLFANSFDEQGCIQCVTVKKGEYSSMTIQVNYEAAY
jgi:hypothetical protein